MIKLASDSMGLSVTLRGTVTVKEIEKLSEDVVNVSLYLPFHLQVDACDINPLSKEAILAWVLLYEGLLGQGLARSCVIYHRASIRLQFMQIQSKVVEPPGCVVRSSSEEVLGERYLPIKSPTLIRKQAVGEWLLYGTEF